MEDQNNQIFAARQGYNLLAKYYESWYWYPFWRSNEGPIIKKWLETTNGVGLDAGCGNAPYLLDYAGHTNRTILMDFSEGMLEQAQARIRKFEKNKPGLKKNVSVVQADITSIPLKDHAVDFVLCSRVLSNVKAFESALDEFSRVLRPGGRLLLTDVHPSHAYEHTGINTAHGRINIETYKHQIPDLLKQAYSVGFVLEDMKELSLLNLKKSPDPKIFSRLYKAPTRPIFFVLYFKKTATIS